MDAAAVVRAAEIGRIGHDLLAQMLDDARAPVAHHLDGCARQIDRQS
ncbi:hypothetical protein [Nocardia sp. CA-119907]